MKSLLLIYNADSGHFNAVIDTVQKMIAPESYSCSLCAITHGPLFMRQAWRDFLAGLDMDIRFFHRDEYDVTPGTTLPVILVRDESGSTSTLLSADDIGSLRTIDELIDEVNRRLVTKRNTP